MRDIAAIEELIVEIQNARDDDAAAALLELDQMLERHRRRLWALVV